MLLSRFVVSASSIGLMVLGAVVAFGQDFPTKPIRIVAAEPGGNGDFNARLIAQGLTSAMGQTVIVDNRGGGIVPGEIVAKAPADGYTLLVFGSSFWIAPLVRSSVPYDPVKDFSPITMTVSTPNILVVHPAVPAKSVKELITVAKGRPGMLNYASAVAGSPNHLAAELFKSMAGVDIVRIDYKGAGPALNGLIVGEVQLTFASAGSVAPHLKSGKLNALAVTGSRPSPLLPGFPTVAASGLPGYEAVSRLGVFAPARTPVTIIKRLNQEIVRFLNQTDVKERILNSGGEAVGSSPEEFGAAIKSDMIKWGKVIKDAGIKVD